ncbi:unnamed protein product [Brugia timori]|uniref:DUF5641 domain-containing protein n=1 Tax=Brugia timori TaxID=42155 RepID=A0A0R3QZ24_9BILA|nr:unnamed protein product [Brugia timori]
MENDAGRYKQVLQTLIWQRWQNSRIFGPAIPSLLLPPYKQTRNNTS